MDSWPTNVTVLLTLLRQKLLSHGITYFATAVLTISTDRNCSLSYGTIFSLTAQLILSLSRHNFKKLTLSRLNLHLLYFRIIFFPTAELIYYSIQRSKFYPSRQNLLFLCFCSSLFRNNPNSHRHVPDHHPETKELKFGENSFASAVPCTVGLKKIFNEMVSEKITVFPSKECIQSNSKLASCTQSSNAVCTFS